MSAPTVERPVRAVRGSGSPGLGGYVLAVIASACALGLLEAMIAALDSASHLTLGLDDLAFYPVGAVLWACYSLFYGLPAALVGCVVVHLTCLRISEQVVHVAMAALAGAVAGWVYDVTLFGGYYPWLWLELGIATTIGRAVVIPLAVRRQS